MKPYRADNVGSMLRPDYLREARKQRKAGELTQAEFKRIEDRAVDEAIAIQESAGLDVMDYGSRWGKYRIRLQPGEIDKYKDILTQVVAEAYAAAGQK